MGEIRTNFEVKKNSGSSSTSWPINFNPKDNKWPTIRKLILPTNNYGKFAGIESSQGRRAGLSYSILQNDKMSFSTETTSSFASNPWLRFNATVAAGHSVDVRFITQSGSSSSILLSTSTETATDNTISYNGDLDSFGALPKFLNVRIALTTVRGERKREIKIKGAGDTDLVSVWLQPPTAQMPAIKDVEYRSDNTKTASLKFGVDTATKKVVLGVSFGFGGPPPRITVKPENGSIEWLVEGSSTSGSIANEELGYIDLGKKAYRKK